MIGAALLVAIGGLEIQSGQLPVAEQAAQLEHDAGRERQDRSRWFARAGVAAALYNSGATIDIGGATVPGATARITDNVTPILEAGHNLSDKVAVLVMVGIPPRPSAIGKGTAAPLGKLGAIRIGPLVATAIYRLPEYRGLRAYVGAGGAYAFILKDYDGAVTDLKVRDNWGLALQGGVELRLSRRLELFVDYKRLWLEVKAKGMLGQAPVRARVTMDPDVISAGVKLNFR